MTGWKQNYKDYCPKCKKYSLYVCDLETKKEHIRRYKCRNCGFTDYSVIRLDNKINFEIREKKQ